MTNELGNGAVNFGNELDGWCYSAAERQSRHGRLKWAESLILQLPEHHEGRNSWLMNYGVGPEAQKFRDERSLMFIPMTRAAETTKS
jgi:hypothetical protein